MSSTSPEWQLARQSGGRVRAASCVVISLFLVLIVLAWHLGTTPKAAHHHKTYLHYWHRVPDALDREISGLEFIRKSLEFQWLGGPPTPSHSLNKHLLHEQAVSNSRHGQHAKKCAPERISRCHADCNPKIYSLSTRQGPKKNTDAKYTGTGRPDWLTAGLDYYKCMHVCLGRCEEKLGRISAPGPGI